MLFRSETDDWRMLLWAMSERVIGSDDEAKPGVEKRMVSMLLLMEMSLKLIMSR